MLLAPSILAADLADLAAALRQCEAGGADLVHLDVMDGHFVPNLTFGPPVVRALAERTGVPLDLHLMVEEPERLLTDYLAARPRYLAVHWEAARHLDRLLGRIREAGVKAGVALNPATPVGALVDVLAELDYVVLMSVNPGFAGQAFLPYVLDKARRLRRLAVDRGLALEIEMDGGLGPTNVAAALAAGVDIVVAGAAVFAAPDPAAAMQELRRRAAGPA